MGKKEDKIKQEMKELFYKDPEKFREWQIKENKKKEILEEKRWRKSITLKQKILGRIMGYSFLLLILLAIASWFFPEIQNSPAFFLIGLVLVVSVFCLLISLK